MIKIITVSVLYPLSFMKFSSILKSGLIIPIVTSSFLLGFAPQAKAAWQHLGPLSSGDVQKWCQEASRWHNAHIIYNPRVGAPMWICAGSSGRGVPGWANQPFEVQLGDVCKQRYARKQAIPPRRFVAVAPINNMTCFVNR